MYVRIDRNMKAADNCSPSCAGIRHRSADHELLGDDERIMATIQKGQCKTQDEWPYRDIQRLRPGEPPTVEKRYYAFETAFSSTRRDMILPNSE
jgi:DNA-directed RNA polymerase subunit beta